MLVHLEVRINLLYHRNTHQRLVQVFVCNYNVLIITLDSVIFGIWTVINYSFNCMGNSLRINITLNCRDNKLLYQRTKGNITVVLLFTNFTSLISVAPIYCDIVHILVNTVKPLTVFGEAAGLSRTSYKSVVYSNCLMPPLQY
jgi:hypothetical protein